ncbi:hypothetical protein M23134_05039 [Microscilla marina ATCC 23134]|uniref:Uncharacterized protein n=1 Tax=Microscilla marina ATCC 23134 TaxID=313606 RepID=A1ZCZ4_MICM2|nr:hypothetical protein M23134_05039 [Microscilla marina ATCC 23134]
MPGDLSKANSLMPPTHPYHPNGQPHQLISPYMAQQPQGKLVPKDANYLSSDGTLTPKENPYPFMQGKLVPKGERLSFRRKADTEPIAPTKQAPKGELTQGTLTKGKLTQAKPTKDNSPSNQPGHQTTEPPLRRKATPTGKTEQAPPKKDPPTLPLAPPKAKKMAAKKVVTNQPSADKIIGFSQLSATQMAAQHEALGKEVKEGLKQDKKEAKDALKPLEVEMKGAEKPGDKTLDVKAKGAGPLREERREPDPGTPRLAKHEHHTKTPPKAKLPEKEEKGFFSRLFGGLADLWKSLTDMTDLVPVADAGINAKAGKAPQNQLRGQANPARAKEQRSQRDEEVRKEKERLNADLRQHPGPDNLQPKKLEEKVEVPAVKTEIPDVETQANEQMKDYLAAQVPPEARQLADERMEEILEPKLAEPRGKLEKEVGRQKQHRAKVLKDKDRDLKKLNEQAPPSASVPRLCLFLEEASCFHVFTKNKIIELELATWDTSLETCAS